MTAAVAMWLPEKPDRLLVAALARLASAEDVVHIAVMPDAHVAENYFTPLDRRYFFSREPARLPTSSATRFTLSACSRATTSTASSVSTTTTPSRPIAATSR